MSERISPEMQLGGGKKDQDDAMGSLCFAFNECVYHQF